MSHSKRYKLPTSTVKKEEVVKDEPDTNVEERASDTLYQAPLKTADFKCDMKSSTAVKIEKKEVKEPVRQLREINMFSRVSNTKKDRPKMLPPAQRMASIKHQGDQEKPENNEPYSEPEAGEPLNIKTETVTVKIESVHRDSNIPPSTSSADFARFVAEVKCEKSKKEEEQSSIVPLTKVNIEKRASDRTSNSSSERSSTSPFKSEKKEAGKKKRISSDKSKTEKDEVKENKNTEEKVPKLKICLPKKVSQTIQHPSLSRLPKIKQHFTYSEPRISKTNIDQFTPTSSTNPVYMKINTLVPSSLNIPFQKTSLENSPKRIAATILNPLGALKKLKLSRSSENLKKKSEAKVPKTLVVRNENAAKTTNLISKPVKLLKKEFDENFREKRSQATCKKKSQKANDKLPETESVKRTSNASELLKTQSKTTTLKRPHNKGDKRNIKVQEAQSYQSKQQNNTVDTSNKRVQFKTLSKPQPKKDLPSASTSTSTQNLAETELRPKTIRLNLTLPLSQADSYPEFNYNNLIMSAQNEDLQQNSAHDDIEKELEDMFGGPSQRTSSISDLGKGYDNTDPFIDDSMPCDEIVPENMTTEHGGFYINSGNLTFRQVETFGSESSDDSDEEQLPKAKKMSKISVKSVTHKTSRRLPAKKSLQFKQKDALKKKSDQKKKVTLKELRHRMKKL